MHVAEANPLLAGCGCTTALARRLPSERCPWCISAAILELIAPGFRNFQSPLICRSPYDTSGFLQGISQQQWKWFGRSAELYAEQIIGRDVGPAGHNVLLIGLTAAIYFSAVISPIFMSFHPNNLSPLDFTLNLMVTAVFRHESQDSSGCLSPPPPPPSPIPHPQQTLQLLAFTCDRFRHQSIQPSPLGDEEDIKPDEGSSSTKSFRRVIRAASFLSFTGARIGSPASRFYQTDNHDDTPAPHATTVHAQRRPVSSLRTTQGSVPGSASARAVSLELEHKSGRVSLDRKSGRVSFRDGG